MNLKKHKLGILLTASLAVAALTLSVSAANVGATLVEVKDFDPASIDWSNVQEGEFTPIGEIDPANIDGTAVTVAR